MTDTIADLLNRLNNAKGAGHIEVVIPYSTVKEAILNVLKTEGYVGDVKSNRDEGVLIVSLESTKKQFKNLVRLSKPGRRVYVKSKNIPRPKGGYGMVVVSTPEGVKSGEIARKKGLGGEIICEVY